MRSWGSRPAVAPRRRRCPRPRRNARRPRPLPPRIQSRSQVPRRTRSPAANTHATPPPRTWPPTGNTTADAAFAAIEARDVDALLALMTFELRACGDRPCAGSPPDCPDGARFGTLVEALFIAECDGRGLNRSHAGAAVRQWLDGQGPASGAYRWSSDRIAIVGTVSYAAGSLGAAWSSAAQARCSWDASDNLRPMS